MVLQLAYILCEKEVIYKHLPANATTLCKNSHQTVVLSQRLDLLEPKNYENLVILM